MQFSNVINAIIAHWGQSFYDFTFEFEFASNLTRWFWKILISQAKEKYHLKSLFSLAIENKYNRIQPAVKHRTKTKFQRPKKPREVPNLCARAASVHKFICRFAVSKVNKSNDFANVE